MLMTSRSGCINIRQNNFQGKNITDKENDFFMINGLIHQDGRGC